MRTVTRIAGVRRGLWAAAVVALAAALPAGCGRDKTVVSGKVTRKGELVRGGTIALHPGAGGPAVNGSIQGDGTFTVRDVPPGEYRIAINTESMRNLSQFTYGGKLPPGVKPPEIVQSLNQPAYTPIPKKYASPETSGLTWDIHAGAQARDIDLPD